MSNFIEEFRIAIPDAELEQLHRRLAATRWPSQGPGTGWNRGVPLDYLTGLVAEWRDHYDWRDHEARLNRLPQFTTVIDGQRVHFLHLRSKVPGALPLILTHGWPGSFLEFEQVAGPLVDPESHGGNAEDAFHVVVPSLPGFGFSTPVTGAGWNTARIAAAWAELMDRLGYGSYGAHGTDLGALVTPELGRVAAGRAVGVHVSAASFGFIPFRPLTEAEQATLTDAERSRLALLAEFTDDQSGYFKLSATRPQTLAYALTDSPTGQLAWLVEKFKEWSHPADSLPEAAISREVLLTNATLHWLGGGAGAVANLYYENMHASGWHAEPATTPTGVSVFATDLPIRRFAEAGNNITWWSEHDRGGHFAALEAPDLLVDDLREFFRPLRGTAGFGVD